MSGPADPSELRRVCAIAVGSIHYLANARRAEAEDMARLIARNGAGRLAADASDALEAIFAAGDAVGLPQAYSQALNVVGRFDSCLHPGQRLSRQGGGLDLTPPDAAVYHINRLAAMLESLVVGPMSEDFILWRCLHAGPLNRGNIDAPQPNIEVDWPSARARNAPLLKKLTRTFGACAILARDRDDVVGTLRFYPKSICEFGDSGAGFCLQQRHPAGPSDNLVVGELPSFERLADKTLFVHCLFIASPRGDPNRYRRKGLATRLAQELIRWAKDQGWSAIEANSYEEIPMLYAISGVAGRRFWERLGFKLVHQDTEPAIAGDLLVTLRKDAVAAGLRAENVANRYRMRLDLFAPP